MQGIQESLEQNRQAEELPWMTSFSWMIVMSWLSAMTAAFTIWDVTADGVTTFTALSAGVSILLGFFVIVLAVREITCWKEKELERLSE